MLGALVAAFVAGCGLMPGDKTPVLQRAEEPVVTAERRHVPTVEVEAPPAPLTTTPPARSAKERPRQKLSRAAHGKRAGAIVEDRRVAAVSLAARPAEAKSTASGEDSLQAQARGWASAVALVLKTLDRAGAAFDAPGSLRAGDMHAIDFLLVVPTLAEELRAAYGARGEALARALPSSGRIQARLHGAPHFQVIHEDTGAQPIGSGRENRWHWHVKALHGGMRELRLTVSVVVDLEEQTVERTETFQRRIFVEALPWRERILGFARDHWQWWWAALIVPLAGWIWGSSNGNRQPA